MPQFDTFIFSSSLFYFVTTFFFLLYLNFNRLLPRVASLLKLRGKISTKSMVSSDIALPNVVCGLSFTNSIAI